MICRVCQMKGDMAAFCRRSNPPYNIRKPQEVSSRPKMSYPPSEVRRSKPGKDKLAKLKDQDKPKEATMDDATVKKLSMGPVA